jgi:hypothetical protein
MAQMIFSNHSVYGRLLAAGSHHEAERESLETPTNLRLETFFHSVSQF